MNRSLVLKPFVILSFATVLAGAPFGAGPSYSQRRGVVPITAPVKPAPPATGAPRGTTATPTAATPVAGPRAVPLTPAPRVAAPARVLATPVKSTARTIMPGVGPRQEAESPDCSVRQFECAKACDPLPEGWSYRECVSYRCRQVDENCLDKLVQELRSRTGDSELTFQFTSNYQSKIQLAFYSRNRDVAWPGSGRVYENNDYNTHIYKLRCNSGEQICYGAWTMDLGSYWGVGLRNRHACTGCCARCLGQTVSVVVP